MSSKVLDRFGKIFISHVRDNNLRNYQRLIQNDSPSELASRISKLTTKDKELLEDILFATVDKALFDTLFMFEEYSDEIELIYKDKKGKKYNIEEISGGIMGELFTEDGWIARFSDYEEKNQKI